MENKLTVDEMYNQYEHLVKVTLHKLFKNPSKMAQSKYMEYDDLMQFGRMGLFKGCKTFYSANHNSELRSFLIRNIRWSIMTNLTRSSISFRYYRSQEETEDNKVNVISMSNSPHMDSENPTTYYDTISHDNINNFTTENDYPENQVVSDILIDNVMKVLNNDEKEILKYRIGEDQLSYEQIGKKIGLTKQGVQVRFKNIQKKCQRYLEVVGV